jgi:hypothetical protein
MTYEGPGITTRSEVKRSVKEGKGKLAMPIFVFEEQKQVESNECGVVTGKRKKEEGNGGGGKKISGSW